MYKFLNPWISSTFQKKKSESTKNLYPKKIAKSRNINTHYLIKQIPTIQDHISIKYFSPPPFFTWYMYHVDTNYRACVSQLWFHWWSVAAHTETVETRILNDPSWINPLGSLLNAIRSNRQVLLVEQELLTLLKQLNSPQVFGGVHVPQYSFLCSSWQLFWSWYCFLFCNCLCIISFILCLNCIIETIFWIVYSIVNSEQFSICKN